MKKILPIVAIIAAIGIVIFSDSGGLIDEPQDIASTGDSLGTTNVGFEDIAERSQLQVDGKLDEAAVWGVVVDELGKPISNARVELVPVQAFDQIGMLNSGIAELVKNGKLTSASGAFRIPVYNPNDEFRVVAYSEGRVGFRSKAVQAGEHLKIQLVELVQLTGQVLYSDGSLATNAQIQFKANKPNLDGLPGLLTADQNGFFEVLLPPMQEYEAHVRTALGKDQNFEGIAISAKRQSRNFTIKKESSLTIKLVNTLGEQVKGARVEARTSSRQAGSLGRKVAISSESGECEFGGLSDGYWFFSIFATGYANVEQRIQFGGDYQEVLISLLAASSLSVQVVDPGGSPASDVSLRLLTLTGGSLQGLAAKEVTSDAKGNAQWPNIKPGEYAVIAGSIAGGRVEEELSSGGPGTQPSSMKLEIAEGVAVSEQLILDGHSFVHVKLTRNGIPVKDGKVSLHPLQGRGKGTSPRLSNEQGVAKLAPVRPGRYLFLVEMGNGSKWRGGSLVAKQGVHNTNLELPSGIVGVTLKLGDKVQSESRGVLFRLDTGAPYQTGTASSDGRIEFDLVEKGEWRVEVRSPGLLPWISGDFTTDGSSPFEFGEIQLQQGADLRGVVSGLPPHKPNSFAVRYLEIVDESGNIVSSYPFKKAGTYQVKGVIPGHYYFTVKMGNKVLHNQRIQLNPGGNVLNPEIKQ